MIEAWGRGFDKIKDSCDIYDGPLPEYDINADGIMVLCKASDRYLRLMNGDVHVLGRMTKKLCFCWSQNGRKNS